ncbi:hypothetical protein PIB30_048011 [Stylosanthes scabra]|uniref:2-oxo-4-hydroxy-4-carboxy-5-ureidoimidazoline decarboxylase n=1 Tax=Stylosanthes scabra TaxID=79078 RepID=A0ABU6WHA5_9FABA|nr:hypothetical protein [Stylosanthes scabra]
MKSVNWIAMEESDLLVCCPSLKFAKEMVSVSPFASLQHALDVAKDVWFNKLNVYSWLLVLNAHPNICEKAPFSHASYTGASTCTKGSSLEEIYALSVDYLKRFGFPYFWDAPDWDADTILLDLKNDILQNFFRRKDTFTVSPVIQTALKDFDLNKKPYPLDDLDLIAREKARRLCEILNPGEYHV